LLELLVERASRGCSFLIALMPSTRNNPKATTTNSTTALMN